MTNIKLTVNGAKATAEVDGILTSGSVGIPVTIEYDSSWNELTKNLVCTNGKWRPTGTPRAILNIGGSAYVAPEAMIADDHLYLGIEGRNADGTLVICTTWADCGTVFAGADTAADPSTQPAMPVWAQLQEEIAQLKNPVVSDAQISTALDLYFVRNPIKIPDSLENSCLPTTEQINALDGLFKVCAFTKEDVSAEYAAFKAAFGITDPDEPAVPDEPDEPDTPTVTLSSISATYSGSDVAVGTAVTDLTGIVVTAHYSDGTSAAVTGYTLSGTIAEGENTVTVTYQGKTATFTVNGFVETTTPLGVEWTEGVYTLQGSAKTGEGWEKYVSSDPVPLDGYTSVCIGANTGVSALWSIQVSFYDADNVYISGSGKSGYLSATNTTYPSPLVFEIPEGAEYAVLSTTISTGSSSNLRYYTDLDWYLE